MKTDVVFFPFDLFGAGGAAEGAHRVAEAFREILDDNRRETVPTRARAYTKKVRLHEATFETLDEVRDWRARGAALAAAVVRPGGFFVWAAGNHLGALPVYDALAGTDTLVVQLDAHLDIHHFADCTAAPSHGNFLLHARAPRPPVVNVGHRELLLTPEYVAAHYRAAHPAAELFADPGAVLGSVTAACQQAGRVVLDVDWDVLDAAYFPAVARPVPFGLSPAQLLAVAGAAWSPRVAGVVLSEFHPARDADDRCLALVMWFVEWLLLKRHEPAAGASRTPRRGG